MSERLGRAWRGWEAANEPNDLAGERVGLDEVAVPVVSVQDDCTRATVRALFETMPRSAGITRPFCVELGVEDGDIRIGPLARPVVPGMPSPTSSWHVQMAQRPGLLSETLFAVGQILRRTGQARYIVDNAGSMINPEWRVIVDIDLVGDPPRTGFELESLGRTLFISNAYLNSTIAAGPEYLLNPPVLPWRLRHVGKLMPQQVVDDLQHQFAALPEPTEIACTTMAPYGLFGATAELIYCSPPHDGDASIYSGIEAAIGMGLLEVFGPERGGRLAAAWLWKGPLAAGRTPPDALTRRAEWKDPVLEGCRVACHWYRDGITDLELRYLIPCDALADFVIRHAPSRYLLGTAEIRCNDIDHDPAQCFGSMVDLGAALGRQLPRRRVQRTLQKDAPPVMRVPHLRLGVTTVPRDYR